MTEPVRVGLAGAGQWAATMHAPLHGAGADTQLAGVWSRDPTRAQALAARFGVQAYRRYADLLQDVEAVDIAVPPDVQPALAIEAAAAGRALLLEKPLAETLIEAERTAAAVRAAQVPNLVVLSNRYHPATAAFLQRAASLALRAPVSGLTGTYLHGGFLRGGFLGGAERDGWRQRLGALFDLGPHLLDLMDAAAGPIVSIHVTGNHHGYMTFDTVHLSGAIGQAAVSGSIRLPTTHAELTLYSGAGTARYSNAELDLNEAWPRMRREFAAAVRGSSPVTVDVERALHLQRLLAAAQRSLRQHRSVHVAEFV